MRTSKTDIEKTLARIKLRFGVTLGADWTAGRPRIETATSSRYLSPRGSKSEIALWLDGFEAALDLAESERREIRVHVDGGLVQDVDGLTNGLRLKVIDTDDHSGDDREEKLCEADAAWTGKTQGFVNVWT